MGSDESQLVAGLHLECYGISPDVPVHVVEPEKFIQRYTDVVALGENALVGRARLWSWPKPVHLYSVSPSGLEHFEDGSLPREEAEQIVQVRLEARAKLENYRHSTRLQRTAHFINRVLRRDSAYLPKQEQFNALDFPEVILFREIDGNVNEVVVDRAAEEAVSHAFNAR